MDPARLEQIQDLYHSAVDHAPSERGAFLNEACGLDAELRREVESLLAQNGSADGPMQRQAISLLAEAVVAQVSVGDLLGPYKIESLLGAGGMGQVYKARDTRLGRTVAIKIAGQQFNNRFEREARAIASLNHSNICTLYDVGPNYLVMELIEGSTLADRIRQGPIPLQESLTLARQIAAALEVAHKKGIIHRDLKPANIRIRPDGSVKVLDFGLATAGIGVEGNPDTPAATTPGTIMGTPGYMAPEQVRGERVDTRTDLFSLGVILFEMVTGERPFTGSSAMAICHAILHDPPREFGNNAAPGKLKAVVRKLLEKDPANRYESAGEVQQELNALAASLSPRRSMRLSRIAWTAAGTAVVLAGILGSWLWHRSSRARWALETAAPEIARLVDGGEYVKAAALTREARLVLPNDPTLGKLWIQATGEVSIASVPPGADISIRPYRGEPNAWKTLGKTPLKKVRIARDDYVWRLVKPGFASEFRVLGPYGPDPPGAHFILDFTLKLRPEGSVPPEMLVVHGGGAFLAYPTQQAPAVSIGDFLIDRHEVTNEQYKKFVDAGGYQKRQFWKQPFVKDGKTISWEEATASFRDGTGRPGPATWEVGSYREGMAQHPVAGVSWYEAAAYAEFAGKSLPTAYHWAYASQAYYYTPLIASGSNFRSEGTQPVGSSSALSGYGTTDMAGNVKEWCLNEGREGKRFILGGGFGEPAYMFNFTDEQSPWDRRSNFGFRCVRLDSPPSESAAARIEVTGRDYSKDKPVSTEIFKAYTGLYTYDKGELQRG